VHQRDRLKCPLRDVWVVVCHLREEIGCWTVSDNGCEQNPQIDIPFGKVSIVFHRPEFKDSNSFPMVFGLVATILDCQLRKILETGG